MLRLPSNSTQERAVSRAHEIMGNPSISSCRRKIRRGCRQCCNDGSYLFRGENLQTIPEGVEVVGSRITNCLGPQGCRFSKKKRPLLCKMSPVVNPFKDGPRISAGFDPTDVCPATIRDNFRRRVREAVLVLIQTGIWEGESCYIGINPS